MSEKHETPTENKEVVVQRYHSPPTSDPAYGWFDPVIIGEIWRMAKWVMAAGIAPDNYTKEKGMDLPDETQRARIAIGIQAGREIGLAPVQSLSTIAVINNRPTLWGDGATALVQRTGLVEKIEQFYEGEEKRTANEIAASDFPDDYTAVFRIWRKGHGNPYEGKFSVRDAKRAHLWLNTKRQPWIEYPKRMLLARARAYALREGFADALRGISIREEIEDLSVEPAPTDTSWLHKNSMAQKELIAPTEAPMEVVLDAVKDLAEAETAAKRTAPHPAAGTKIIDGLKDAVAHAKGDETAAKVTAPTTVAEAIVKEGTQLGLIETPTDDALRAMQIRDSQPRPTPAVDPAATSAAPAQSGTGDIKETFWDIAARTQNYKVKMPERGLATIGRDMLLNLIVTAPDAEVLRNFVTVNNRSIQSIRLASKSSWKEIEDTTAAKFTELGVEYASS